CILDLPTRKDSQLYSLTLHSDFYKKEWAIMQFADAEDIQYLRQLLKGVGVTRIVGTEEIKRSECEFMYSLLHDHWAQVPAPDLLLSYAQESELMPLLTFKKLVDVRLCEAD
ncbi:hypothetical protein HYO21_23140, partial [Vibrio parahaemolyticus]|nr:hypothetical protein [Vibrio parahaemolyticus]